MSDKKKSDKNESSPVQSETMIDDDYELIPFSAIRGCTPGKRVNAKSVSGVRIPLTPPDKTLVIKSFHDFIMAFFFYTKRPEALKKSPRMLQFVMPAILRGRDAWQGIPSMCGDRKMSTAAVIHRSDKVPLQVHP